MQTFFSQKRKQLSNDLSFFRIFERPVFDIGIGFVNVELRVVLLNWIGIVLNELLRSGNRALGQRFFLNVLKNGAEKQVVQIMSLRFFRFNPRRCQNAAVRASLRVVPSVEKTIDDAPLIFKVDNSPHDVRRFKPIGVFGSHLERAGFGRYRIAHLLGNLFRKPGPVLSVVVVRLIVKGVVYFHDGIAGNCVLLNGVTGEMKMTALFILFLFVLGIPMIH